MNKAGNIVKSAVDWMFGQQSFDNLSRPKKLEDGTWFYPVMGGAFEDIDYIRDFLEIPEANSVINKKANMYANGVFKVVNNNGVEKKNDAINNKLKKPNWFQTQKEFMRQTCLFHEITGNEYLYMFFGTGLNPTIDNLGALYTLPPNLVRPRYLDTLPFYLFNSNEQPKVQYEILSNKGSSTTIPSNEIIHLNDNRVVMKSTTDVNLLKGMSTMHALRPTNNNMRMSYESRHIILKYRGALGILSSDSVDGTGNVMPIGDDEKDIIQDGYRQYGGLKHQRQIIITSAKVKWQQIIVNPDKLGLWKETEEGLCRYIAAYGMDRDQFPSDKGATYENKRQADKDVYQNTIIPAANERMEALNEVLMAESNYKIVVDYSHLPIFQEDIKHRAEALAQYVNSLSALLADHQITQDEYREELRKKFDIGDGVAIPVELPSADNVESETKSAQAALRGSVGGVQGILAIQASVGAGTTTHESALSMLTIVYGFSPEDANALLGEPVTMEAGAIITPTDEQAAEVKTLAKKYKMSIKQIKKIYRYE